MNPPRLSRGFSLVEAMIVLGLLAGASIITMQLVTNSNRATQTAQVSSDFTNLINSLYLLLGNETLCTAAIKAELPSTQITPAALASGIPLTQLTIGAQPIIKAQPSGGTGLVVRQLGIRGPAIALPAIGNLDQYVVKLHVSAERVVGGGGAIGGSRIEKDIDLGLTVDKVTRFAMGCYGQYSAPKTCAELGGTYNPGNNPPCALAAAPNLTFSCGPGEVLTGMTNGVPDCAPAPISTSGPTACEPPTVTCQTAVDTTTPGTVRSCTVACSPGCKATYSTSTYFYGTCTGTSGNNVGSCTCTRSATYNILTMGVCNFYCTQ